jgi:hypothetical protein
VQLACNEVVRWCSLILPPSSFTSLLARMLTCSWRAMEWCNGACTRHAVIIIYVAARGRAVADVQLACDEVVPWCSLVLPPSLVTLLLFTCMCVYVSCACATRGAAGVRQSVAMMLTRHAAVIICSAALERVPRPVVAAARQPFWC